MDQEEHWPSPPSSLKSLGQRVRWHRLRLGLSQEALAEAVGASARSLRRWEQDLSIPQKVWRERLARQFRIDPEQLLSVFSTEAKEPQPESCPPAYWTVPYARNPCFTGRESILRTISILLAAKQPVALTQATALSGLGGIGKTQIALEYAYRYRQEYCAVFWLAAETSESLTTSLQQIAELAQLPEREVADQARLVLAICQWLAKQEGWLAIVDNVEDLEVLQPLLPALGSGKLLLTTRRQALGTLAQSLELPPMTEEEGIRLLLSRVKPLAPPAAEAFLPATTPLDASTSEQAARLVHLLEGLPLALDQAGSYLQETGCQVADYVQHFQDQRKDVLARRAFMEGAIPPL